MGATQKCPKVRPIRRGSHKMSDDCRLMMLASLQAMTEELAGKFFLVGGSFLQWSRSCTFGVFDNYLNIGVFVEQWDVLKCWNCIKKLNDRMKSYLLTANRPDLAASVKKALGPQVWYPEYIEAKGRVMPVNVHLQLLGNETCRLAMWILHQNGTHMTRYSPTRGRAWVSKLRPLRPIVLERIGMYAPFPVEDAVEEEFGPLLVEDAIEEEFGTGRVDKLAAFEKSTMQWHWTPLSEMKDTVFTDCGFSRLSKLTRGLITGISNKSS
eukprot:gnl/MRDRNA2_/MRDRNA2_235506_c0_seq1.p1 gnl/MRDRNA2_/MRDRNA2_235506_c0~~gnl/MRDRNA2_/MRDRNA2_235506_c0_seq1.p1  ORF type:complete len:298 (-),score=28.01 gnl/MRDRNA2_/MRDRNA2_235506_c0_seq1:86-886(-)